MTQRLGLSQKVAGEAYDVAATTEPNPRSVWGYVQGLTRLSQRLPWQDQRFAVDQAATDHGETRLGLSADAPTTTSDASAA